MPLIIEDGSIVSEANSLSTVSEYRNYLESQGDDTQNETDTEIENRLIGAMRYLNRLEPKIKGERVQYKPMQSLLLPRNCLWFYEVYLIPSNIIPNEFKNAQIIAAKTLLTETLEPDLENGGHLLEQRVRLEGVVEKELRYSDTQKKQTRRVRIIGELKPFLKTRKKARLLT